MFLTINEDSKMNRVYAVILFISTLVNLFAGTQQPVNSGEDYFSEKYVPNVLVMKLSPEFNLPAQTLYTGAQGIDAELKSIGVQRLERVFTGSQQPEKVRPFKNIYYAYFTSGEDPSIVAARISRLPGVEYAEPKYMHYIDVVPNDPLFGSQSFFSVIQAPQAWDIVKGEQGTALIAVVDGGTDFDHPDLTANFWINPGETPGNGIDDDGNGFVDDVSGWNFANNSNDPSGLPGFSFNSDHGSHTAGSISAVSDNGIGVAGASWNATLMPICASSATSDRSIEFGFDGILYAADNGADIISCSWGRQGGGSAFEQDVITYVSSLGAVVVAAAGNNSSSAPHFPSSYPNCFSVAATANNDVKAGFSNYGTTIDVAAPGVGIWSTMNNGSYGTSSGTSMSTPITAGVIGLVKTQHPEWSGLQAAEQVRVTADNIDGVNPIYIGLLGRGRINAARALTETSPSIRLTDFSFADSGNDGIIDPGESVTVSVSLINYLAAISNINVTITVNDSWVTLIDGSEFIATMNTMQTVNLTDAFSFTVDPGAPSSHPIFFKMTVSSGNYTDTEIFKLIVLPTFGTADVNNVALTVTNIGRIGFADLADPNSGIGFIYQDGPNMLFEGALICGTGAGQISNAARGLVTTTEQLYDEDFVIADGGDLQIIAPGNLTDQESIGSFTDTQADNPMNIRITQETFASTNPDYDDFVLFKYTVENLSGAPLTNFHLGLFFDWDIDGNTYATNRVDFDPTRKLGYAWDGSGNSIGTYAGVRLLSDIGFHYRAIANDGSNGAWGIYDGFTDDEKYEAISGGAVVTNAGPADISHVVAGGPVNIAANNTAEFGFALVGGGNRLVMRANSDKAQDLWDQLFVNSVENPEPFPARFILEQNYPNPFNPVTMIRLSVARQSKVSLEVFDLAGRKVRTLLNEIKAAGTYEVRWNGLTDSGQKVTSGVYYYRMQAGEFIQTRKLVMVK